MSVARGILAGGRVIPGTDFVLRDRGGFWEAGDKGTRPRTWPITALVMHWTAGPFREGPSAGPTTVRNMRARKDKRVGIQFVISADGLTWQCADLAVATIHIGDGHLNARSIGVEHCWPGTVAQAEKLKMTVDAWTVQEIAGERVQVVTPPKAMVEASIKLADTLSRLPAEWGVEIHRCVPIDERGETLRERMRLSQLRGYHGALAHYHLPNTTKRDEGGLLLDALRGAGWKGVRP